jgi:hypothetical protein
VPAVWVLVPTVWVLVPAVWVLVPAVWVLVPAVWVPANPVVGKDPVRGQGRSYKIPSCRFHVRYHSWADNRLYKTY